MTDTKPYRGQRGRPRAVRKHDPTKGSLAEPLPMLTPPPPAMDDTLGSNCLVHDAAPGEPCYLMHTDYGDKPGVCGARIARAAEHLPGPPRRPAMGGYVPGHGPADESE
jgi:hypothetical protein